MVLVVLKTIKMHWWVSWWLRRGNHGNVAIVVVVKGMTELWMKMGVGIGGILFLLFSLQNRHQCISFVSRVLQQRFLFSLYYHISICFISSSPSSPPPHFHFFPPPPPPLPHFNCFTTSHYDIT